MMEKSFIDTNIFIYAFEKGESSKKKNAIELIKNEDIYFVSSIQVLSEFVNATIKKNLLSKDKAVETALIIEEEFEIIPLDRAVFLKGMEVFRDKNIYVSLWDSLIIASAILSECSVLYSEDMQHDFVFEDVKIKNPFL
ncbi:MAG: PIN domain-containing protein [Candidatus Aminicenantes bacterium]|nr:PIN domain-containing protein [Candidatus Aminicenantes bacterium]NIM80144.1 PIN domain-containing protein [Candidatus Aminicenantes bacterium]NIN19482.1 PIN domain-containing protein [Candidatus Aminicenantes bacterium]NIN43381.1 PIN domain-containing protein [Candidatus Aminicenantes bacterium]NIN86126.1 PIN domain-containing protein [Candidatus Aminicenantes bacterium]